jgi:glutathione S-transferase
MPKPDLLPLTGGYRQIPVLQIGADIYCDSERIALELERRYPTPTLFPKGGRGMAAVFGAWVATSLFQPATRYAFGANAGKVPPEIYRDRAAMRGVEFTAEIVSAVAGRMHSRLLAQAEWLESLLGDGRMFLLGDNPGLADCSVFPMLAYLRRWGPPVSEALAAYSCIQAWMGRMDQLGQGQRSDMTGTEALDIARRALPEAGPASDAKEVEGFRLGDRLVVTSSEAPRDATFGEVVRLAHNEVALRRAHERVGEVVIHFPRIGFELSRA